MKERNLERIGCQSHGRPLTCTGFKYVSLCEYLEFMSVALDASPLPFASSEIDGTLTTVNQAFCNLVGYTREELLTMSWIDDLTAPEFRETEGRMLARLNQTGKAVRYEMNCIRKDGSSIPIEMIVHLLCDEKGNPAGYYVFCYDISGRRNAEEALWERNAELARVQELTHIGFYVWDTQSGRGEGSEELYRILGIEKGDVEPTYGLYISMVHPDDRQRVVQTLQDAIASRMPGGMDYRIIRPDGNIRWVHGEGRIICGEDGSVRVYGTVQDITRRKQAEEGLRAAKAQAELYLDLMGHDINNMHQIALGYLELARDMIQTDECQKEFLDKPIEALQRSSKLISNVRKMQNLLEGSLQAEVIDLCSVLTEIQQEYGSNPHKPVTLKLNSPGPCKVRANELLHDVFANLVANAIKHTGDYASISIILDKTKENGCQYYRVSVEDNGPGIPDDLKCVIFYRMLKGTTMAKGIGLGLYLVKSLVDSYNGMVWVEDRVPGDRTKGARFVVMLPAIEN